MSRISHSAGHEHAARRARLAGPPGRLRARLARRPQRLVAQLSACHVSALAFCRLLERWARGDAAPSTPGATAGGAAARRRAGRDGAHRPRAARSAAICSSWRPTRPRAARGTASPVAAELVEWQPVLTARECTPRRCESRRRTWSWPSWSGRSKASRRQPPACAQPPSRPTSGPASSTCARTCSTAPSKTCARPSRLIRRKGLRRKASNRCAWRGDARNACSSLARPARVRKRTRAKRKPAKTRGHHHPELVGLVLVAFGLFLATVLWVGWNGGYVGGWIGDGLEDARRRRRLRAAGRARRRRRPHGRPERPRRRSTLPHGARRARDRAPPDPWQRRRISRDRPWRCSRRPPSAAPGSRSSAPCGIVAGILLLSGASAGALHPPWSACRAPLPRPPAARGRPRAAGADLDRQRRTAARPSTPPPTIPDVVGTPDPAPLIPFPEVDTEETPDQESLFRRRRPRSEDYTLPDRGPAPQVGHARRRAAGSERPGRARARPGARRLRRPGLGGRPDRRPARDPLRAPARARHQDVEGLGAQGRPLVRARHDRDPHPRADPGQAGRRRRSPEPVAEPRHARRHLRRPAEDGEPARRRGSARTSPATPSGPTSPGCRTS